MELRHGELMRLQEKLMQVRPGGSLSSPRPQSISPSLPPFSFHLINILSPLINPSCLSPRILLIPKIYHRRSIILTIAPAGPRKSIEQAGGVGCEGARHPGPIKDQQGRRDHPHGAGQSCGGTGQECQGYRERGKWRNRAAGCRDSHSFPRNTAMSFIQYPPHRF